MSVGFYRTKVNNKPFFRKFKSFNFHLSYFWCIPSWDSKKAKHLFKLNKHYYNNCVSKNKFSKLLSIKDHIHMHIN